MKKITAIFVSIFLLVLVSACAHEKIDVDLYETDKVEVTENLDTITIKNNFISVSFDLDHGSMKSLMNVRNSIDYIKDTVGGNFSMVLDLSTGDPFRTDYQGENAFLVTSRNQAMTYKSEVTDEYAKINFVYDLVFSNKGITYKDIIVNQEVKLEKATELITINYQVVNNSNLPVTIVNFTGAQLSGLKDNGEKLSLFWPNKEGKIYEEAIERITSKNDDSNNLVNVYPGLASMQLVQLYNEKHSMYYIVEDSTR